MEPEQEEKGEILTIQKFIYLLDDFHFKVFSDHLESIRAQLPLKLVKVIREHLPNFDSHHDLCVKVYGNFSKNSRQNFNQLASYTFKLSQYLAQNYPAYLTPNLSKVQQLVNRGEIEEAKTLYTHLLNMSERIEDFEVQKGMLKFLIQQSYILKDANKGLKYSEKLNDVYENEKNFFNVLQILRSDLNISVRGVTFEKKRIVQHKKFFESFFKSESSVVRLMSKYAHVYLIYYFEPDRMVGRDVVEMIRDLERDMNNNCYVVFPFLFDMRSNLTFFKLNSAMIDLGSRKGKREFNEMTAHYQDILFWRYYLNIPEIFTITAKASHYISSYHFLVHRTDYERIIPREDLTDIKKIAARCKEILAGNLLQQYKYDVINLRMIYGVLSVLSGNAGVKTGVEEIESLLIEYQQINLAGSMDSIFICLMIGYFAMKKYDKCAETFKRYSKLIKGKPIYDDNDISIHTYYYLAQWLSGFKKQYLEKLQSNYQRTLQSDAFAEPRRAMEELTSFFNVPVQFSGK